MSTKYFILSKQEHTPVNHNDKNQILTIPSGQTYLLPDVNLVYYSMHGLFESNLIEWCKQFCRGDKVFLDIGAHTGTYSISLAGLSKEVHAFEPQKNTYYALCGGVALSNLTEKITCHPFGLGSPDQVGEKMLKMVSNDGGGSSLHATKNILREEKIVIKTLDSLRIDNIGFIKMDVEENEHSVLLGAMETLKASNYPPILFECNDTLHMEPHQNQLIHLLKIDLGYQVIPLKGASNMFLASMN